MALIKTEVYALGDQHRLEARHAIQNQLVSSSQGSPGQITPPHFDILERCVRQVWPALPQRSLGSYRR